MKRSRLNPISKKRRKESPVYARKKEAYLRAHPRCERCGHPATDLHHRNGRGKYFLDETTYCSLCRPCHDWVTTHGRAAALEGWIDHYFFMPEFL